MRKIGSDVEIEKKRKRNATIVGVFLLIVLVLGTVGYGFLSNPNVDQTTDNTGSIIEEGQVVNQNGRWAANFNGQVLYFTNSPESTKNISVEITSNLGSFAGKQLYIDSTNSGVIAEIAQNLGAYAGRMQEACYLSCERDIPEKDCTENMIVWKDSTENKVYQNQNCIFIEGDLRAVDAFLYEIFEIN